MRVFVFLLLLMTAAHAQSQMFVDPPIVRALQKIAPGALWSLQGTDCTTLVWYAGNTIQKPTCDQINAAIATISPANVPESVNSMQAKVALSRAGLLAVVENWIKTQDAETQLMWATTPVFHRNGSLIARGMAALGITDAQMDQLFIAAAQINP